MAVLEVESEYICMYYDTSMRQKWEQNLTLCALEHRTRSQLPSVMGFENRVENPV